MIIREFQESDQKTAEEIFALYWTDPEFLKELSEELQSYIRKTSEKNSGFFVAEEHGEILGIIGFRTLASYLKPYTLTDKPTELYVIAVKYKRKGVGEKLIQEAREFSFSEILLYNPNSHNESWGFYEKLGFKKVGEVMPPDDDTGFVWQKFLGKQYPKTQGIDGC